MQKEIILAHYPKINIKRYQELMGAFSNLENVWQATFNDLKKNNWQDNTINDFIKWRNSVDEIKIQKNLDKEEIYCVTIDNPSYPELLRDIYDPPFCLFIRGNLNNIKYPLAIVGPRKYSIYGKQNAENFAFKLARAGFTIISGLALGIDGIAHSSALEANGATSAVLGAGINKDNIYPSCHKQLSEKILSSGGALISEYPPGTMPNKFTFPTRNRIVAGMCLGTLVIEGAEKSGALITAQCALDSNREVFAIPQNINSPTAGGANKLLKTGAHLITEANDILEILNMSGVLNQTETEQKDFTNATETEQKIISVLTREPIHIDIIVKNTMLPSQTVYSTLALMEISGKIKNLGSMMFVLNF